VRSGLPANGPAIFLGPDDPLALPTVAAHFLAWFVSASVLAACNLFHSLLQHLVGNATTLQSIRNADYRRRRGRPPLRPFLRAAAALAAEDLCPLTRLSSASHSGPVSTVEKRPGTLGSRSRLSKCKALPRPRISTARISRDVARLRLGTRFTGKVIAAPFVSSICNARSFERPV